jgi:pantoate--beta-alanine ligase
MVEQEGLPVEIVPMPIVREQDGLAMSSRNVYLSAGERMAALVLASALREARRMVMEEGVRDADSVREAVRARVVRQPLVGLEYVSVADEETMAELDRIERPALILVAAKVGSTRLIDNVVVVPLGMAVPEGLRELVG